MNSKLHVYHFSLKYTASSSEAECLKLLIISVSHDTDNNSVTIEYLTCYNKLITFV